MPLAPNLFQTEWTPKRSLLPYALRLGSLWSTIPILLAEMLFFPASPGLLVPFRSTPPPSCLYENHHSSRVVPKRDIKPTRVLLLRPGEKPQPFTTFGTSISAMRRESQPQFRTGQRSGDKLVNLSESGRRKTDGYSCREKATLVPLFSLLPEIGTASLSTMSARGGRCIGVVSKVAWRLGVGTEWFWEIKMNAGKGWRVS